MRQRSKPGHDRFNLNRAWPAPRSSQLTLTRAFPRICTILLCTAAIESQSVVDTAQVRSCRCTDIQYTRRNRLKTRGVASIGFRHPNTEENSMREKSGWLLQGVSA